VCNAQHAYLLVFNTGADNASTNERTGTKRTDEQIADDEYGNVHGVSDLHSYLASLLGYSFHYSINAILHFNRPIYSE
jgi:hypothetical protein